MADLGLSIGRIYVMENVSRLLKIVNTGNRFVDELKYSSAWKTCEIYRIRFNLFTNP